MMDKVIDRAIPYVVGQNILSLGYSGDNWPKKLLSRGGRVDIVEGAKSHYELAQGDFADTEIRVFYDLFEEFMPDLKYDTVIAGSIIEFFEDPNQLLAACRRFLRPSGRLIVTTPNALSIHRRIGAILGVESSPFELNEAAKASLSFHLYTQHTLKEVLIQAKWNVEVIIGAHLKLLSAAQMKNWSPELVDALDVLSQEMSPDFCKNLIAVCNVRP